MQSTNLNDIEMVEQPALAQHASEQGRGGGLRPWLNERITSTTDRLWVAGAEMGVWNFLGTALQVVTAMANLSSAHVSQMLG